ncbi:MAG: GNAT family N-acetyltransferase [Pirellulales bacterium]
MQIRSYEPRDRAAVVRLSLRAWAPVFPSIEQALDPAVYRHFFPDWRQCQQKAVEDVCADQGTHVWVGEENGNVIAFTAIVLREPTFGEIYMIAVDPDVQQRGIATALTNFALDWMRQNGVIVAMVETGADPGHAPARRTYERCGFRLSEVARYFKKL